MLAAKKNLRLLASATSRPSAPARCELRSVAGGFLVQTRDRDTAAAADARRSSSKRAPTADELRDLEFAWRVCKHVKSNAIVFAARRRARVGDRRRADVARRLGAASPCARRARRWPGCGRRVRRVLPVPRRRRRGGRGRRGRGHPAGRLGARRRSRSPPPTSTAWRWCSPACATSGTEAPHAGCGMRILARSARADASTRSPGSSGAEPAVRRDRRGAGQPRHRRARPRSACIPVAADATAELVAAAVAERVDLVVVRARGAAVRRPGATRCARPGLPFFGPSRAAARARGLEGVRQAADARRRRPDRARSASFDDVGGGRRVHRRAAGRGRGQGRRPRRRQGRGRASTKDEAKAAARAMLAERRVRRRRARGSSSRSA